MRSPFVVLFTLRSFGAALLVAVVVLAALALIWLLAGPAPALGVGLALVVLVRAVRALLVG